MSLHTYKKSPILEAVLEIRFESVDTSKSLQAFSESIKDRFPSHSKGKKNEVRIDAAKDKVEKTVLEFDQFISEDGKFLLQLDDGRLSVHRLQPYTTWSEFLPTIIDALSAHHKHYAVGKYKRIGLRYINSFKTSVTKVFNISYDVPNVEAAKLDASLTNFMFDINNRDKVKILLGDLLLETSPRSYTLDIDYFNDNMVAATVEDVSTWIDTAHTTIENIFENYLTLEVKKEFDQ